MARTLRLVLVTPEKTLLDEPVDALRFPLYDGQFGVLPGRSPVVGRLGFGELKITSGAAPPRTFYLDGGFVQITGSVVTLLTNQALLPGEINVPAVQQQLETAVARVATTDADRQAKDRDVLRARQRLNVAKRGLS
jgi:F-type H+-transporting ATPase subunit epsilon